MGPAFSKHPPVIIEKSIILANSTNHTPTEMIDASQGEEGFDEIDQTLED